MEFNLKQWRERQQESEEEEPHSAKLPRLLLDPHPLHQRPSGSSAVLPLFVPAEPTTNLSAYHSDATNKFPSISLSFSVLWHRLRKNFCLYSKFYFWTFVRDGEYLQLGPVAGSWTAGINLQTYVGWCCCSSSTSPSTQKKSNNFSFSIFILPTVLSPLPDNL